MHEPNEPPPIQAVLVSRKPRRKIPLFLTILLALVFGVALTMTDGPKLQDLGHPIAILGFVAEACSHAIVGALLLEGLNWLWSRLAR
jgi:hypothetical protein